MTVHRLPSSQDVLSGSDALEHCPVAGSQVATWQSSAAEQTTGLAPVQTPAWQVSVCVHALPSSHLVPVRLTLLQNPSAQTSCVQALPSSHSASRCRRFR
jgi:hypothetical protein